VKDFESTGGKSSPELRELMLEDPIE